MRQLTSGITVILAKTDPSGDLQSRLRALDNQTIPPGEVLVADGGVEPVPEEKMEREGGPHAIRYLHHPGETLSILFNEAVESSSGTVIAFLKEGSVPCPTWIEVIYNTFCASDSVQVLQGKITTEATTAGNRIYADVMGAEYEKAIRPKPAGVQDRAEMIHGDNFAIRRDLIRRFRMPFDERLEILPNVEFSWELLQEGIEIVYSREMEVRRRLETGLKSFVRRGRSFGFDMARVKKIQDDFWDADLAPIKSLPAGVKWLIKDLTSPWRNDCISRMAKEGRWADVFRFYPVVLMQRLAFAGGLREGKKSPLPTLRKFVTPVDLQVFVTNRCNLRCRHCFFHENIEGDPSEIKPHDLRKIIRSLNRDLRALSLVGGEPFLSEDLAENCRAAAEGIHVKSIYIITNGTATSKIVDTVREILKAGCFDLFIRVSLEGFTETHDRIRGPNSFHRALQTLRRLILLAETKSRLHVEVETIINSWNIDELESFADFVAGELNIFQAFAITRDSSMFCQTSGLLQPSYGPPDDSLLLSTEQLSSVEPLIERIYKRLLKRGHLNPCQVDWHMRLVRFDCRQSLQKRHLLPCLAGEEIVTILPNYDVALCEMGRPIGNLSAFDFDLKKLLKACFSEEMRRKRDGCYCSSPCTHSVSILRDRGR